MSEPQGERLDVPFDPRPLEAMSYRATDRGAPWLIFAHGAGAGQHSGFITSFARALAARGVTVTTFDFPYVQQHRKAPDRPPVLEAAWRAMLTYAASQSHARAVFAGGKSMGGRIASQVLATSNASPAGRGSSHGGHVSGLVLLGYPLYPPGRPEQRRTAHLPDLRTPVLIVQGERDSFGTAVEVEAAFAASPTSVRVVRIEGGDHSFKVPKAAGPQRAIDERIRDTVRAWIMERADALPT